MAMKYVQKAGGDKSMNDIPQIKGKGGNPDEFQGDKQMGNPSVRGRKAGGKDPFMNERAMPSEFVTTDSGWSRLPRKEKQYGKPEDLPGASAKITDANSIGFAKE